MGNVNTQGDHQQALSAPGSHEYNTLGKMRRMSLVLGLLGVLAVIITLNRQQILILNTIDMMTTWLQTDYNSTLHWRYNEDKK